MAFERRQATRITSARHIAMLASVMKKQGTPVVLVPLTTSIHAGHRALVRAAQRIPGALVIVAIHPDVDCTPLIDARVDAIFTYTDAELWPSGPRTLVNSPLSQAAGGAGASVPVTRIMALLGIIGPTDLVLGEKNIRQLVQVQQAITDLHYPVVVHEVPTVRTSEGLPVSNRYADIPPADHDKAVAVSASLRGRMRRKMVRLRSWLRLTRCWRRLGWSRTSWCSIRSCWARPRSQPQKQGTPAWW